MDTITVQLFSLSCCHIVCAQRFFAAAKFRATLMAKMCVQRHNGSSRTSYPLHSTIGTDKTDRKMLNCSIQQGRNHRYRMNRIERHLWWNKFAFISFVADRWPALQSQVALRSEQMHEPKKNANANSHNYHLFGKVNAFKIWIRSTLLPGLARGAIFGLFSESKRAMFIRYRRALDVV